MQSHQKDDLGILVNNKLIWLLGLSPFPLTTKGISIKEDSQRDAGISSRWERLKRGLVTKLGGSSRKAARDIQYAVPSVSGSR